MLNSKEIKEFLDDAKLNSETFILEEGKEKDEIAAIAKARGYVMGGRDLGFIKNVYAFTGIPNNNKAILNEKGFLKALPTMIGKPINLDHRREQVIGHLLDYRYVVKDKKCISYGVIYKSVFTDVWDKIVKLFKEKKLTTSYEIWSPEEKRKFNADGTFELEDMEIAADAILFKGKPAFEDAKVLEIACEYLKNNKDLVFASDNYKCLDLIISGEKPECRQCGKCKIKQAEITTEVKKEETIVPEIKPDVKIKCSNCQAEIDLMKTIEYKPGFVKCPNCFAILNRQTGEMIYPPQIRNFKAICPVCKIDNWLILSNTEEKAAVQCNTCAKKYNLLFAPDENFIREKFKAVYIGSTSCLQCNYTIAYSGVSNVREKKLKCDRCGLEFDYNLDKINSYKKIKNIKLFDETVKASLEGGEEKVEAIILTEFHSFVDVENFDELEKSYLTDEYAEDFETAENAKKMTYEEKQGLSDDDFAVVVKVENKKTGEIRKIRKYPINDEAHVRNALQRLGQQPAQDTLKSLGVSIEEVKKKILSRAKKLGMADLLKRYESAEELAVIVPSSQVSTESVLPASSITPIVATELAVSVPPIVSPTVVEIVPVESSTSFTVSTIESPIIIVNAEIELLKANQISEKENLTKAMEKIAEELVIAKKEIVEANQKVDFYKANAKDIIVRRGELGKISSELSDEDILNDDKFELAKLKINLITAKEAGIMDDKVGDKRDDQGINYLDEHCRKIKQIPVYNIK